MNNARTDSDSDQDDANNNTDDDEMYDVHETTHGPSHIPVPNVAHPSLHLPSSNSQPDLSSIHSSSISAGVGLSPFSNPLLPPSSNLNNYRPNLLFMTSGGTLPLQFPHLSSSSTSTPMLLQSGPLFSAFEPTLTYSARNVSDTADFDNPKTAIQRYLSNPSGNTTTPPNSFGDDHSKEPRFDENSLFYWAHMSDKQPEDLPPIPPIPASAPATTTASVPTSNQTLANIVTSAAPSLPQMGDTFVPTFPSASAPSMQLGGNMQSQSQSYEPMSMVASMPQIGIPPLSYHQQAMPSTMIGSNLPHIQSMGLQTMPMTSVPQPSVVGSRSQHTSLPSMAMSQPETVSSIMDSSFSSSYIESARTAASFSTMSTGTIHPQIPVPTSTFVSEVSFSAPLRSHMLLPEGPVTSPTPSQSSFGATTGSGSFSAPPLSSSNTSPSYSGYSGYSGSSIAGPSSAGPILAPAGITEDEIKANSIFELFVKHIEPQGSPHDRNSMRGLIKDAIPVRGVKMLRIRYELHTWWREYKRDNGVPSIGVQKAFAFRLLASEWFEDKLAAVLFMQEVLITGNDFGVNDLDSFEAAFANDHIGVYKVCDHLTDKVLYHIAHSAPANSQARVVAIEKFFTWTAAPDMWQARAALCALTNFNHEDSIRERIFQAAVNLMKRPEEEAKSAAGAALRELSKNEPDRVLAILRNHEVIVHTSSNALKKATNGFDASVQKELRELRKDVIALRRSKS